MLVILYRLTYVISSSDKVKKSFPWLCSSTQSAVRSKRYYTQRKAGNIVVHAKEMKYRSAWSMQKMRNHYFHYLSDTWDRPFVESLNVADHYTGQTTSNHFNAETVKKEETRKHRYILLSSRGTSFIRAARRRVFHRYGVHKCVHYRWLMTYEHTGD